VTSKRGRSSQPRCVSESWLPYFLFNDITLNAVVLNAEIANLFFFMDCAVSELAFSSLASPTSAGWLAINAFFTATRLLINDFFWIDILFTLSWCYRV
jgi:hypothetical protein